MIHIAEDLVHSNIAAQAVTGDVAEIAGLLYDVLAIPCQLDSVARSCGHGVD